jgi:hypothetical protein
LEGGLEYSSQLQSVVKSFSGIFDAMYSGVGYSRGGAAGERELQKFHAKLPRLPPLVY